MRLTPQKLDGLPKEHADPLDTPKPTPWTLHGPSERDPAPSARTQASAADQENVAGP